PVITKAVPSRFFNGFSTDIEKTCYASYFAEVMDYISRENDEGKDLLLHLYVSLLELEKDRSPLVLVRSIFELRTLKLEGVLSPESIPGDLLDGTRHAVRHINDSDPGHLYAFQVSEEVKNELAVLSERLFRNYTGHKFTSLDILDAIS
ncbi:MAG: DNA repair protein RecO C-terminal domain-containing protein, partial [Lachnospiraceae bacterium]|nr:DNA repair protein RecO C-terminal domain-containing protein [Lachnospiraceae bacterium]